MSHSCLWIRGTSRSGKTTRLVKEFQTWVTTKLAYYPSKKLPRSRLKPSGYPVLVFAPNDDHRQNLADKLSSSIQGGYPMICKTPLGFISDEVTLFWPLLIESLSVKAQLPLRLSPETEQELATKLWSSQLNIQQDQLLGGQIRLVRRLLDLIQLAGASCTPLESIPQLLREGLDSSLMILEPDLIGQLLSDWRTWCLARGLLTYGLIYDLYWSYLLPNQLYRQQLTKRYEAIFADNVDDYPAIARDLLEFWLDQDKLAIFTYNPDGQVRQGLNADPEYMVGLSDRCQVENLERDLGYEIISLEDNKSLVSQRWRSIETTSRAELLRKVSAEIINLVKTEGVKPAEIAIIAPGLDEIARYSFLEILSHQQIPIEPLNEQRPLNSSPIVRALLTLLALVYPGLGVLVNTEAIAEMLVVVTNGSIDPVRAGLLADYCYQVDRDNPNLLPPEVFPRWDRLGAQATQAYQKLTNWITAQKQRIGREKLMPIFVINQAIQDFFSKREYLNYGKLAVLREFAQTAQHYWEIDNRLRENGGTTTLTEFIKLLRSGIITANPYPLSKTNTQEGKVTLATIFQYRSLGSEHPWQFWLDIGSPLWSKGGAAMLWGAPLFLRSPSEPISTPETESEMDQQRLARILRDLQARTTEGIYLCHSELSVNGTEQLGPLLSLIYRQNY